MRKLVFIAVLFVFTLLSGCSSQAIYNDLQRNFQAQCYEKFIGSALQECLERYNTNYNTFKQRNEEVLGKDDTPNLAEFEKRKAEEAKEKSKEQDSKEKLLRTVRIRAKRFAPKEDSPTP